MFNPESVLKIFGKRRTIRSLNCFRLSRNLIQINYLQDTIQMNFGFAHESLLAISGKIQTLHQHESVTIVPRLKLFSSTLAREE